MYFKSSPARPLAFFTFLLSILEVAAVQNVNLAWNANPESNLSGYRVYVGSGSGAYNSFISVAAPATTATVPNLLEGQRYYFAVTAYNSLGQESGYSPELSYMAPTSGNLPPTLNPIANVVVNEDAPLQSVPLSGITSGSAAEQQPLQVTATSSFPGLISPVVTYTSPNTSGTLTFKPAPNAFGTALITVTVSDGQAANSTVIRTFSVTVNPLNDPPTLDPIANVALPQNSTARTVTVTGISSGSSYESQPLTVSASSSNPGLVPTPSVRYASPNSSAALSFLPAANAWGDSVIGVSVSDGQSTSSTITRYFRVTVNNPPTLDALANLSIVSDGSTRTVPLTGISAGAPNESQPLTITAISSAPNLISPVVTYSSPSSSGYLTFKPATGAAGTAVVTVTVNDGQNGNNTLVRSFSVIVSAVANKAPTLDLIPNVALVENATKTVYLSGISSGSTNESQTLTVTATSSNPALIPNPALRYLSPSTTGALSIFPVANAWGSAVITVTVNDGAATNNVVRRTFVVTVNTPPTLNALPNLSLPGNAPAQTVLLQGISSGSSYESQPLTVTATSSNPALIPNPAVTYATPSSVGMLTFAPVANASGTATITVTVRDAQFANSSTSRAFQVTVAAPTLGVASVAEPAPRSAGAPTISNLLLTGKDARTLAFSWQTDVPCDGALDFGLSWDVTNSIAATSGTNHFALVTNLEPGTVYYVRARAMTADQQSAMSETGTASTASIQMLKWYASSGALTAPMDLAGDLDLETGTYITSPIANSGNARFDLFFSEGSTYRMWCHARVLSGGGLFAIDVDGLSQGECSLISDGSANWQWLPVMVSGTPAAFLFDEGLHTLIVNAGPSGLGFDQFILSDDPQWRPTL